MNIIDKGFRWWKMEALRVGRERFVREQRGPDLTGCPIGSTGERENCMSKLFEGNPRVQWLSLTVLNLIIQDFKEKEIKLDSWAQDALLNRISKTVGEAYRDGMKEAISQAIDYNTPKRE